jgi:hypothetical protein
MASKITYRLARKEIPGVYVVKIALELQSYEEATVNVGRYRDRGYQCGNYYGGSCGLQRPANCYPRNPLEVESRIINEYAEITNFWVNDTITIEVRDKRLEPIGGGPYQIVRYTATMDGINTESLPCVLHGRTWQPITLNEILLVCGEASMPTIPAPKLPVSTPRQAASPMLQPPNAQVIPLERAIKQLEKSQYGFITKEEVVSIVQLLARGGFVDLNQAIKTLSTVNKRVKKEKQNNKQENLAVQQAREIIESNL